VEKGTARVKFLAQEQNTMSPARAQTWTTPSGDECTNHEATAPPIALLLYAKRNKKFERIKYLSIVIKF